MTWNSTVNSTLALFPCVSPSMGSVILQLSYFALGEFRQSCNGMICLLLLARHLHLLFCLFNMWMNCQGKGFDQRIPWDQGCDLILILVSSGIFFLSLCWKYATFDLLQVCCKGKIFWDFCCLNFVTVWGFCLSVFCVGYSCNSLIYFSWDISSCLNALFCLMLPFFSPSSLLLCIVGIIQLLRAVSSFLLQSQSFSTSLATYVILFEFGVFVLVFICLFLNTVSQKSLDHRVTSLLNYVSTLQSEPWAFQFWFYITSLWFL